MTIGLSVIGVLIVVVAVLVITVFIPQGVISSGNQQEARLNSWYSGAVASLNNCVVKTARAAQVTGAQTNAVDEVLKDAVGGKYGTGSNVNQPQMFSALVQAYPDGSVAGLNKSFQDALATMTGCQDDFVAAQNVVQSHVADFKSWRTGSWISRAFGGDQFPNENLEINIAGMPVTTGAQALTIMERPIISTDTANAVSTGENNEYQNNPFNTGTSSPTK